MTSIVDMSLEDIIQKKRRENQRAKGGGKLTGKIKRNPTPIAKKSPVMDARNKIISKKRNQIIDAREKLGELAKQKDARLKLEALRTKRALIQDQSQRRKGPAPIHNQGRNILQTHGKIRRVPRTEIMFGDPSRQVVSQPISHNRMQVMQPLNTRKFLESGSVDNRPMMKRSMMSRSIDSRTLITDSRASRPKPIMRTVENDLELIDDSMGEDYSSPKPTMFNRKANLQLRIIAHNNEIRENRSSGSHRLSTPEKDHSPPRPASILKKRPMAALRLQKSSEKAEKPIFEYRIIVSNLRNTVTGGDIEELFGDVGGMVESRLVRPGTAEVIYKSVEDAQRAVELYHNRQLDGQPMNCLLVTPRAPSAAAAAAAAAPARNGSKPVLYSTNSNVEPDISTFHKVLFSHF